MTAVLKSWEMHGETHLNPTYLHCLTSDEEVPPENKRTHCREMFNDLFFFPQMFDRANNIVIKQGRSD